MQSISKIEEDIKSLKIQGATNVALKVLEGLLFSVNILKLRNNLDPHIYLLEETIRLAFTRPTEPLAQNAVRFIFQKKENSPQKYLQLAEVYKQMIFSAKNKIANSGSSLIENGATYLTHCHSTSVTGLFIKAAKEGKKFQVITTETRPKFQGRKTANDLLSSGLDNVTMIVDNLASSLILENKKNIKGIFIGSDLLSQHGFVNKIGSLGIAFMALQKQIPVFAASSLLKYDPQDYQNDFIEERPSSEIWSDPPEKLKFYSPAFDFIPYYENITLITEAGLLKGNQIKTKALEIYPFLNFNLQTR